MSDAPGAIVPPGRGDAERSGPPMVLIAGVVSLIAVLLLGLFVVVLDDGDAAAPPDPGVVSSDGSDTTVAEQAAGTTLVSTAPTTTEVAVPAAPTTTPTATPTTTPTITPSTAAPATTTAPRTTAPLVTVPPTTEVLGPSGPAFARNPRFSLQVDGAGQPSPEVVAIADGQINICLTWDFFDVPLGIPLRMNWYVNGVLNTSFDGVNDVGSLSGVYFACNFDPAGLPSGLHEIEWSADGTIVFRHGWYVGEGSIPIDVEVVNSISGLDVCDVNVSPQAATSFGIPLNRAAVPAGDSILVRVPDGVYDIQATACDGTIVTEEYGIDVLGPMTIQI